MRTRTGKIARLPGAVREELNRRLDNGAMGKDIVPWLNELPDVKRVMLELFNGRPVTENNLSEWRHGGFQDWLREEDRRERLRQIADRYENLGPEEGARRRDSDLYQRIAAELMMEMERLSTMSDDQRWKRLQKISQELCRLQRTRAHGSGIALCQTKAARIPNNSTPHSKPLRPSSTYWHQKPPGEGGTHHSSGPNSPTH